MPRYDDWLNFPGFPHSVRRRWLLVKPGTPEHRNSINPEHGTPEH